MRICIPTCDDRGLKAEVYQQFGEAPFYTLVDDAKNEVKTIINMKADHGPGTCQALGQRGVGHVDAVVCPSIGRRAVGRITDGGIEVIISAERTVSKLLAAIKAGRVRRFTKST